MTSRPIAKPVAGLLAAAVCVMASPHAFAASAADPDGPVHVLTDLQFSSAAANANTLSIAGWGFGAQKGGGLLVAATPPPVAGDDSFALEATYPATTTGGQYTWADYSVASLNTEDVYIDFWAKMPDAKEGLKFLKIFGKDSDPQGHARMTFGVNYTNAASHGGIPNVEFGDGTTTTNDGQNSLRLDGTYPDWIGRSYGIAKVLTPQMTYWPASDWGTSWHHFRVHAKFNSGTSSSNEVPNGEIYLEIDGTVWADATGLYDRNSANGPINYIEFGGWAQTDPQAFDVWFDNIRISTGGFVPASATASDGGVDASEGGVSAPEAGNAGDAGVDASADGAAGAPDAGAATRDSGNAVHADAGPRASSGGGCGCTMVGESGSSAPTPWFALAALALIAWRRRESSDDVSR